LNSYKLGFSLLVGVIIFLLYNHSKAPPPAAPLPPSTAARVAAAPANRAISAISTTTAAKPTQATPPHTSPCQQPALAGLLPEADDLLQEILALPVQQELTTDELTIETYAQRLTILEERFEGVASKAMRTCQSGFQRFMWEQLQAHGLEHDTRNTILNQLGGVKDLGLLREMLDTLSNSAYSAAIRSQLAATLLRSDIGVTNGRNVDTGISGLVLSATPTPNIQLIQQFMEEQFPRETDPDVLEAYLSAFHELSQSYALFTAAQFSQYLETVRPHLRTNTYFEFRLQQLDLRNAQADYAGFLRDINATAMTPAERQAVQYSLNDNIAMFFDIAASTSDRAATLPEQQRQSLLHYLATNLIKPDIQNPNDFYQYGRQAYTLEKLRDPAKADDVFYAKIINSQGLEEQMSLLSATNGDEWIIKRLQQNPAFLQTLKRKQQQSNLHPALRQELTNAIGTLTAPAPDSEPPASQYLGY
jgi:hypothetical protein